MSIICRNHPEPTRHEAVETVRACYQGADIDTCGWLVEAWDEDGRFERLCGAEAIITDRGFTCAAGHEHVTMQARHAERWDYAEEWDEALALAGAGVEPRTMTGHVVTSRQDFAS